MLLSKTYKRHVPDNIAPVSPKLKKIVPPINIEPLPKLGEGLMDKQFFFKKKVKTLPKTLLFIKKKRLAIHHCLYLSPPAAEK